MTPEFWAAAFTGFAALFALGFMLWLFGQR